MIEYYILNDCVYDDYNYMKECNEDLFIDEYEMLAIKDNWEDWDLEPDCIVFGYELKEMLKNEKLKLVGFKRKDIK